MTAPSSPSPSQQPNSASGPGDQLVAVEANFQRAVDALSARPSLDDAGRHELGVAWMNVAHARLRRAERDQSEETARTALAAYVTAVETLEQITLFPAESRRALGAAWLNRAVTLHALGEADAPATLDRAIGILGEPSAKADAAGASNLAGALLNRAAWRLEASAATGAYDATADAAAAKDLALAASEARAARPHPSGFFAELNARLVDLDRRARQLAAQQAGEDAVGDFDDEVAAAITVVREARALGLLLPPPMVGRAVNVGAQLLAAFQPQFLLEFLAEHRDLAAEPNPVLSSADFRSIASAALARGRDALRVQWMNPATKARRSFSELSEIEASLAAAAALPEYAAPT